MRDGERPIWRPFDGLLFGPENSLAHASILALAKGEKGLSPFVLHGPSGVGKTRLLAGLAEEFLDRHPESSVVHLTAEEFAGHCASARSIEDWLGLRRRFRTADLFILDDIHILNNLNYIIRELEISLDVLDARGARVAVSARSGPGSWSHWPARFVSRLVSGLVVRVDPPGKDLKRRYLFECTAARGVTISAEAAELLSERADGFRTLEGWLAALAHHAKVKRSSIERSDVEELILGPELLVCADLGEIAQAVARSFDLPLWLIRSTHRGRAIVGPRHLAMYLMRKVTKRSYAKIGSYFSGRDAKTTRHACHMTERRLIEDPALQSLVNEIDQRWRLVGGRPGLAPETNSRLK